MEKLNDYNPIKSIFDKIKIRKNKGSALLINMELINGMHKQFLIIEKEGTFNFNNGKYIIDNDSKYYNINAGMYSIDYHERYALPIKRVIPITNIKKIIEYSPIGEVEYSSNPQVLEHFVTSKIAEGIMKGQQIDEMMRKIWIFLMVIGVLVLAHFVLYLGKSGVLQQLKFF